jgi:RNA polymerase sigma-70 factor (ECF subfamily)
MADEDLGLLDSWSAGDSAAGNKLFQRNFALVYRFFETKTEGEIDDLVQETFLACLKGSATFRRQSTFRTYLLAIARHTLFHYWRKRRVTAVPVDFDEISVASLSTSVGTKLATEQQHAALLAALRQMPLDQQALLELYYWEDLDRDALAAVFEVEPTTIGTRLFRARQALRGHITQPPGNTERSADPNASMDDWIRSHRPAGGQGDHSLVLE